ncbi:MAG: amino acid permease, partial [Cyanobacteria bacterium]|nr:amino acid permease [Cyanobacteriota bacterium]
MSRDGLLPPIFAKLHPKYRTPFLPTLLTGVFVAIFSMFIDIGQAAELTNIGTLAAFIIVCGGVLLLRKTSADHARPFRCPLVPFVPYAGIFFCFVLMLSLPVVTWIRFAVWMGLGALVYFLYGFKHSRLNEKPMKEPAPSE